MKPPAAPLAPLHVPPFLAKQLMVRFSRIVAAGGHPLAPLTPPDPVDQPDCRRVAGSRYRELAATHFIPVEHPDIVLDELKALLAHIG